MAAPDDPAPDVRGQRSSTWVLDLDGVVWLTEEPIEGSAEAVRRLRQAGVRVRFATNNAEPTRATLVARLGAVGIPAEADDVVTSAEAAAGMLAPGSRVHACGGPGLLEALAQRGIEVVDDDPPGVDAVVVGLSRSTTYADLAAAASAVRAGGRLIGTNEDATFPTPHGLLPGAGALVAAVATASGARPTFAGKPHRPMAELIRNRWPDVAWVVGDRPSTDGRLARQLGVPFGLVLSGVTDRDAPPPAPRPAATATDLLALVTEHLSHGSERGR